jgi:hypothetical protein
MTETVGKDYVMNAKRYLPRAMMVFAAMLLLWRLWGAT